MTVLHRLLKHPHAAVFDKAPGAELALRVRHADGSTWNVADEVLTVTAGTLVRVYLLSSLTIEQLASALVADGFEVLSLSSTWAPRSALALVEGSGDQRTSNGDHLEAFTSILWGVLSGYGAELHEQERQIGQALRQMVITQAEGEWLNLWGALYSVGRNGGEVDTHYAQRIPQEAFRLRVNAHGIEKAIFDATGWDVRIGEPWKEIFHLDQSLLSGVDRFYDGERTGYHLIQPTAHQEIDWPLVLSIIERNRAAGVLVLQPIVSRSFAWDARGSITFASAITSRFVAYDRYQDRALLDYSVILDSDVSLIVNHTSRIRREILHSSNVVVPQTYNVPPGLHSRDYRVTYLNITYTSQYWTSIRTWETAASDWSGLNPIITSSHTRP